MRLIDADALLNQKPTVIYNTEFCIPVIDVEEIKRMPTVNAVPVVRCHKCIHWAAYNAEEGDSSGKCRRYLGMAENRTTDGWSFCSDGEAER